jgi:hypothetical protein
MAQVIFIVGSPRSGTTLLENILGSHPEIADWYEPYYVWERFFSCEKDDVWRPRTPDERTKSLIRKEYRIFGDKSQKSAILDKSPGHVFNIPVIHSVFPEARWIHIVRDGRDVTLSIRKEWNKRKRIVEDRDLKAFLKTAAGMLKRQPFLRYKLMAVFHELKTRASINTLARLNKSRWDGKPGWGPRFEGWREFLQTHSELEYNAMQWVRSIEAAQRGLAELRPEQILEIRYENLIRDHRSTLSKIMQFLGYRPDESFFGSIPKVASENRGKWRKGFSAEEIAQIKPVLNPTLKSLGYLEPEDW